MKDKLYKLYLAAFPHHPVKQAVFEDKLLADSVVLLTEEREGTLWGFALVDGNAVTLLAVHPDFQGRGIGRSLLAACEEQIAHTGGKTVKLGQGRHYLMQGVPSGEAVGFFEKQGYSASWESEDMGLSLTAWEGSFPCLSSVRFGYAGADDYGALLAVVERVNPNWVRYFTKEKEILVAEKEGVLIGFAILEEGFYSLDGSVGSVGCVGVLPEARRQGVGRGLVAAALFSLREKGYRVCELRYVSSADFYAPLGFTVTRRFWMGKKTL